MLVLGIETSCDETSIAVVEDGTHVQSCIIASSGKDFQSLGGVIPEDAARKQLEVILPVLEQALCVAGIKGNDVDAIAVTAGPGLIGSLLVGTMTSRVLADRWKKPLIPVHHTLGHLSSTWLTEKKESDPPRFPVLTLSVSGGHTDLWYRTAHTKGALLGSTIDDAAGEAFDKGAMLLGLPYPGGPALSKLAESGNEDAFQFPRPLAESKEIAFSFSGLKTSLKYRLRDLKDSPDEKTRTDLAASYQRAICSHLVSGLQRALETSTAVQEIHVVGGVSANRKLREMTDRLGRKHGVIVRTPESIRFCTDNGAMIAAAGTFLAWEKPETKNASFETNPTLRLSLDQ